MFKKVLYHVNVMYVFIREQLVPVIPFVNGELAVITSCLDDPGTYGAQMII